MKKIFASVVVTLALMQAGAANAAWYDGGFGNGKFVDWWTTAAAELWVCGWDRCAY